MVGPMLVQSVLRGAYSVLGGGGEGETGGPKAMIHVSFDLAHLKLYELRATQFRISH